MIRHQLEEVWIMFQLTWWLWLIVGVVVLVGLALTPPAGRDE